MVFPYLRSRACRLNFETGFFSPHLHEHHKSMLETITDMVVLSQVSAPSPLAETLLGNSSLPIPRQTDSYGFPGGKLKRSSESKLSQTPAEVRLLTKTAQNQTARQTRTAFQQEKLKHSLERKLSQATAECHSPTKTVQNRKVSRKCPSRPFRP